MKTAVSLPDPLFRDADKLARRLGKSRSQLYQEALKEYVDRHSPEAITDAIDRVCESVESKADSFVREAARRTLEKSEW